MDDEALRGTYRNEQNRIQIKKEVHMFEEGVQLPVRVNGINTGYTGELNSDPEKTTFTSTRPLTNGGKIATHSGASGPQYVYPDAPSNPSGNQYETVEELDADISESSFFVPELAEWAEQHAGGLIAYDGAGLGQHHSHDIGPDAPTTFRAEKLLGVANGKAIVTRGDQIRMFPCFNLTPLQTVMQPLGEDISDAFETGMNYEVTENGVLKKGKSTWSSGRGEWVLSAEMWDAHVSWLRTNAEMTRDLKLESDGARSFNSDNTQRVSRYLFKQGDDCVGTEIVINDDTEPVEIVDAEYVYRGMCSPPSYKLEIADGRRLTVGRKGLVAYEPIVKGNGATHSFPVFSLKVADESAPDYAQFGVYGSCGETKQVTL